MIFEKNWGEPTPEAEEFRERAEKFMREWRDAIIKAGTPMPWPPVAATADAR